MPPRAEEVTFLIFMRISYTLSLTVTGVGLSHSPQPSSDEHGRKTIRWVWKTSVPSSANTLSSRSVCQPLPHFTSFSFHQQRHLPISCSCILQSYSTTVSSTCVFLISRLRPSCWRNGGCSLTYKSHSLSLRLYRCSYHTTDVPEEAPQVDTMATQQTNKLLTKQVQEFETEDYEQVWGRSVQLAEPSCVSLRQSPSEN